ncbi:threonylcarbamoyl-AMP synthase [Bacillus sp. FJAT-42376]|uniref:L-threonylcarbamoyladenylate synthase n=1 Tax=Bacillus sp. FJAT-42376 TaxID=2014076 RepID=UPI000F4FC678|nr:L-threonylcarbamoyladenylate synthase [Bacillus sp. FJAT-42376]AZB40915.1 threonylcarbamoyl-AMP synthase [Bacillus sp. FJAT-42376]
MNTIHWTVDKTADLSKGYPQITQAAALLADNEAIAFPTETVYGLGANAGSSEAVKKIYEAKGRPGDNPLIVHVASHKQAIGLVDNVPAYAMKLMSMFWPGALTVILPVKEGKLSPLVTAGLSTVAIRFPDHPIALALIQQAGVPIAAPSANLSGKPSPTKAEHVARDLNGRIAGIVDGGPTGVGVESTVLDCTKPIPVILRPGGVTKEQLEAVIGTVHMDQALADETQAPISPGMKYTHYAPNAPLTIVEGSLEFLQRIADEARAAGKKTGILTVEEHKEALHADEVIACGSLGQLETVASNLYGVLRQFNENEELDVIYSEAFPSEGVGLAIMNRLMKAAGHRVIEE